MYVSDHRGCRGGGEGWWLLPTPIGASCQNSLTGEGGRPNLDAEKAFMDRAAEGGGEHERIMEIDKKLYLFSPGVVDIKEAVWVGGGHHGSQKRGDGG